MKLWVMLKRTMNHVYLPHLGDNSKKNFGIIKYGEFFSSTIFPHEMRYRFEILGSGIKGDKEGSWDPKYL